MTNRTGGQLSNRILIVGSGDTAHEIARGLATRGWEVAVSCADSAGDRFSDLAGPSCEVLAGFDLDRADGCQGAFNLRLRSPMKTTSLAAGGIVLAEEAIRQPNFQAYGLTPSRSVTTLGQILAANADGTLADRLQYPGGSVVLLHGLYRESHPSVAAEVMDSALAIRQAFDARIAILTGNLKVAGNGLERQYRRCRDAGIEFFKFATTRPEIALSGEGVRIRFDDPATGHAFGLTPVMTVVDEEIVPNPRTQNAARVMGLEQDTDGFAQADNVQRLIVHTNRRGVFVAGPSRAVQTMAERTADIHCLLQAVTLPNAEEVAARAEIDPAGCARCLTCLRCCPHVAIELNERPRIHPDACQGCGICAASCPAKTISFRLTASSRPAVSAGAGAITEPTATRPWVAFCCSRAVHSATHASGIAAGTPPQAVTIVEVPCGGSVSSDHLLAALEAGAAGVLLVTCHPGNCHAGPGPDHAAARIDHLRAGLDAAGLDADAVFHMTTAANMPFALNHLPDGPRIEIRPVAKP
jgi:quinone-modifying oxidoreductase subunit QmoB